MFNFVSIKLTTRFTFLKCVVSSTHQFATRNSSEKKNNKLAFKKEFLEPQFLFILSLSSSYFVQLFLSTIFLITQFQREYVRVRAKNYERKFNDRGSNSKHLLFE